MDIKKLAAHIKDVGPREAGLELGRTLLQSVWTWIGGPILIASILQRWSGYTWDVQFVTLLVAAASGVVLWRHLTGWPTTLSAASEKLIKETVGARLAHVSWQHGLKDHSIAHPWQLHAIVTYSRHARDVSCYVRWGRLVHYMSGGSAFEWSKQTTLSSSATVHTGKVERHFLASIPPNENQFEIFGDKAEGAKTHENLICIEVVIASPDETQRERRYYGLVSSDLLVAVLIDQERFAGAGDA